MLAVLGALGRLSSVSILYAIATLYVSLVRGTPLLVQILFIYLALPQIMPFVSRVPKAGPRHRRPCRSTTART